MDLSVSVGVFYSQNYPDRQAFADWRLLALSCPCRVPLSRAFRDLTSFFYFVKVSAKNKKYPENLRIILRLNYENEFFSKFVICSLLSEFIYANNQPAGQKRPHSENWAKKITGTACQP